MYPAQTCRCLLGAGTIPRSCTRKSAKFPSQWFIMLRIRVASKYVTGRCRAWTGIPHPLDYTSKMDFKRRICGGLSGRINKAEAGPAPLSELENPASTVSVATILHWKKNRLGIISLVYVRVAISATRCRQTPPGLDVACLTRRPL